MKPCDTQSTLRIIEKQPYRCICAYVAVLSSLHLHIHLPAWSVAQSVLPMSFRAVVAAARTEGSLDPPTHRTHRPSHRQQRAKATSQSHQAKSGTLPEHSHPRKAPPLAAAPSSSSSPVRCDTCQSWRPPSSPYRGSSSSYRDGGGRSSYRGGG